MKRTKREHIQRLELTQRSIANEIDKADKEAHIPVYMLRVWSERIKSAANFMNNKMKKKQKGRK